jgi:aspartate/methionine/tyrosine aminotransferase
MRFSKRTDWNAEESEQARAYRDRVAAGLPIADLTASNPTRCGFEYPPDLLDALTHPASLEYQPEPLGMLSARQAVSRYYAERGISFNPFHALLTTSTSEAYSYLFKLLCDPGDLVLVMQPSYPLFDFLCDAEVVKLAPAPLVYDHGWQLDLEGLRRQITQRTRAVVLVHPNNPTGHFTKLKEAEALAKICREHDLALIVDEVFLDYRFPEGGGTADPGDWTSFAARDLGVLTFVVSGISKICGLPQMKAAWLMATGPGASEAMTRLEVLADTYLSMNAPVQLALPVWLGRRARILDQIKERVAANLAEMDRQLAAQSLVLVNRLEVEGGWYAILRIPAVQPDELTARQLLDLGVWVHTGYFFGFGDSGWLVISLLAIPAEFSTGLRVLLEYFRPNQESYLNG